jgi:hypothetical protein
MLDSPSNILVTFLHSAHAWFTLKYLSRFGTLLLLSWLTLELHLLYSPPGSPWNIHLMYSAPHAWFSLEYAAVYILYSVLHAWLTLEYTRSELCSSCLVHPGIHRFCTLIIMLGSLWNTQLLYSILYAWLILEYTASVSALHAWFTLEYLTQGEVFISLIHY